MNPSPYDPTKHHRRSIRLPNYDYASSGAYYITVHNWHFNHWLEDAASQRIVEEQWQALLTRFPGVALDDFVIMPDYVHFIVWINATIRRAPSLGAIMDAYKSITDGAWRRLMKSRGQERPGFLWQTNYVEHILRSDFELEQKRQYIRNNPMRWELKYGESDFCGRVIEGDGSIPL